MEELNYIEASSEIIEKLIKGAFLTVKDNQGRTNAMSIAWGNIGYMWRKPVFTVMVRPNRYTNELLENAKDFTVNFPQSGQLKKEIVFCGAKSGREVDKFKECGFELVESQKVKTPIIKQCSLHLECDILYTQKLHPDMCPELAELYENDHHILYYGEIKGCYRS